MHQTHLIAESMTAYDDGLYPARNRLRDLLKDDRFAENGAAEDITDLENGWGRGNSGGEKKTYCPVWTLPHFLELKLLDASLVGGDSCTFDANLVFEDGISCFYGDLVVCLGEGKLVWPGSKREAGTEPGHDVLTQGRSTWGRHSGMEGWAVITIERRWCRARGYTKYEPLHEFSSRWSGSSRLHRAQQRDSPQQFFQT